MAIWLALQEAATVELQVRASTGEALLQASARTVAIGQRLHLALVCAEAEEAELSWNRCYHYQLYINGEALEIEPLLYAGGPEQLSFTLPAATLEETCILHGSCRHPTNRGNDALGYVDDVLAAHFEGGSTRPQLFVCSGDLIYADSPSPSLLRLVGELGDQLLGYREALPDLPYAASQIPPKERRRIAGEQAGIYSPPARQLFGLGEYLALHLLVLSPSLWPDEVPADLRPFRATLGKVRRALANTAFYAIFDDHEIIDDWYLTQAWSQRVLSAPLGRRMIANGLSAFALVHAWGNEPARFAPGTVGERILQAVASAQPASPELESDLGMPLEAGERLQPPSGSLAWHFRLQTPAIDMRALDTRSMRAFPHADPHQQPELLSEAGIEEQLSDLEALPVLVVPAPMAPPPRTRSERFYLWLGGLFYFDSREVRKVYRPDRGDEWQPRSEFFQRILEALPARWVCLGGDTHLAYVASVETTRGSSAIFCSSGMQRETTARLIRQRFGFSYPWPAPRRRPRISTSSMTMSYRASEANELGRVQYLSKNNIGKLCFVDTGPEPTAVHELLFKDARGTLRRVEHRLELRREE